MDLNYGDRLEDFALRPLAEDAPLNILHGAIRSGKTMAMLPKILGACRYPVPGWRVIAGVSKSSIYRNILHDLFGLVGPKRYSLNMQSGMMRLCGSDWVIIGANDEGAEKYVRGLTTAVAFVDELTKVPQSFYNMLISRLSPPGSRFYATTNPDSPNHWVRRDVLLNEELKSHHDLWEMKCTLEDNPNLSEDYKERLKRFYAGAFYRRFIDGDWVTAEGAVYGEVWSEDVIFDDLPIFVPEAHLISIDYGTINPFCALEGIDDGTTLWVSREFYWDSARERRQLTDDEYMRAFTDWEGGTSIRDARPKIVIDPSAASFRALLVGSGRWVSDADNDVKAGIQRVCSVIAGKKLRIHRSCHNLIREMNDYAWDDSAARRGIEQPVKRNDHACDALRYMCAAAFKPWRLEA